MLRTRTFSRRTALKLAGQTALVAALGPRLAFGATSPAKVNPGGAVAGEPTAEKVALRVLGEGGNAVDAAVAAALAASVASPHNCGPGGYGGHIVIAQAGGKKITAIDFNSDAPLAPLPEVKQYGWLSAGVPGTLAGLQMALDRYGTRELCEVAAPAIQLAREGFPVSAGMAGAVRGAANELRKDAASVKLLFKDGQPPKVNDLFRNPELADMLDTLASRGSVETFYRGDIARRIAAAFQANGGLVTVADMAAYQAREVKPLTLEWRGFTLHTAPLTAGGLTVLQALASLKALDWAALPAGSERTHALLDAQRVAWHDRLTLLGDPKQVKVPVEKLLSAAYARQTAAKLRATVKVRSPIPVSVESRPQGGTVHLSVADNAGNLVAVTLTHGEGFGARVTVDGLGLTLGHGMSRFEAKSGHPNSHGPRKRPLNNMCPTIVTRGGKPLLAIGGAGGRRIPSAICDVLAQFIALDRTLEESVAAPRLHTEGDLKVRFERTWPAEEQAYLKSIGYMPETGASAKVSAAVFDVSRRECRAVAR